MSARLRSSRFWVMVLLGVSVLSIVLFPLLGGAGQRGVVLGRGTGTVAVVRLEGPIQSGGAAGLFGGLAITPHRVEGLLGRPAVRNADALVLRVNSPGGSVAASEEVLAAIEAFRDETGIPVIVSMGDVAASGGYYIASGADVIVANAATLTGSIGVVWQVLELTGLYEKLGIEEHIVTSGQHKAAFSVGRVDGEAERLIQEMSDQMHDQFIAVVARGRGLSEERVRALATGQPYTGLQARDLGLVDEIGGLDTAVDVAMEHAGLDRARVVPVEDGVFSLFGGAGIEGLALALRARLLGPELAVLEGALDARTGPRYVAR